MSNQKDHKDLGLKIGTKKEVLWSKVKKEALILIEQSEDNLTIQKEMLKMAEEKLLKYSKENK